jgi:hypothetical protein
LLKLPKKYLKNCSFKINLPAVFLELEAGLGRRKIKAGKYFEISTFAAVFFFFKKIKQIYLIKKKWYIDVKKIQKC